MINKFMKIYLKLLSNFKVILRNYKVIMVVYHEV